MLMMMMILVLVGRGFRRGRRRARTKRGRGPCLSRGLQRHSEAAVVVGAEVEVARLPLLRNQRGVLAVEKQAVLEH